MGSDKYLDTTIDDVYWCLCTMSGSSSTAKPTSFRARAQWYVRTTLQFMTSPHQFGTVARIG